AQRVKQRHARFDAHLAVLSVDPEGEGNFAGAHDAAFSGEGFFEAWRRKQTRRHRPNPESFEKTAPRKAGGFERVNCVRHSRLSFWKCLEPTARTATALVARADLFKRCRNYLTPVQD